MTTQVLVAVGGRVCVDVSGDQYQILNPDWQSRGILCSDWITGAELWPNIVKEPGIGDSDKD